MGTSSSYRAPAKPRWHAFVTALTAGMPLDRIRSELFNAGIEWRDALASSAVASYAESLIALHGELDQRLATSERSDLVIADVLAEARAASREAGFSPATALAERAFAGLILTVVEGATGHGQQASEEAAQHWRAARGETPNDLVSRFAGEVLGQYVRHVVDRETGTLAETDTGVGSSFETSQALASLAAEIGRTEAERELSSGETVYEAWKRAVSSAFEKGRAIPRIGH